MRFYVILYVATHILQFAIIILPDKSTQCSAYIKLFCPAHSICPTLHISHIYGYHLVVAIMSSTGAFPQFQALFTFPVFFY